MQKVLSGFVWIYWFFCFLLFLIVVTLLFLLTFWFDKYRIIPNKALKGLGWIMLKPIPTWSFEIKGADKTKVDKPVLIVSNHQSFLDMPLLYMLPWRMKWLAKKSLLKIPFLGWIIAMTGQVMIDRKSLRSAIKLDLLVEPILNGIPGMIFPEGTRTHNGLLQPFQNGAFMLAQKYNFNILPVIHNGGYNAMPGGSWKFNFNRHFTVSVLDPVDPNEFESVIALKNEIYQQIKTELNKIQ